MRTDTRLCTLGLLLLTVLLAKMAIPSALAASADERIDALIQQLDDESAEARRKAAEALGDLQAKRAADALVARLKDANGGTLVAVKTAK